MNRLHSRHKTRANASTVMLDIPPKSRLRGRLCSKFNLDMTSRLFFGRLNHMRSSQTGRLTKLVAFEPKRSVTSASRGPERSPSGQLAIAMFDSTAPVRGALIQGFAQPTFHCGPASQCGLNPILDKSGRSD